MADQSKGDGTSTAEDTAQPESTSADAPETTVNSQITDAVSAINALITGMQPSSSAAMLSLAATQSAALALQNAVARQQADAVTNSAAVVATCARLLGAGAPLAATASPPQGLVATIEAQVEAGIQILKTQALHSGDDADSAKAALDRLSAALVGAAPAEAAQAAPAAAKRRRAAPTGKK